MCFLPSSALLSFPWAIQFWVPRENLFARPKADDTNCGLDLQSESGNDGCSIEASSFHAPALGMSSRLPAFEQLRYTDAIWDAETDVNHMVLQADFTSFAFDEDDSGTLDLGETRSS